MKLDTQVVSRAMKRIVRYGGASNYGKNVHPFTVERRHFRGVDV
jgi:hypothetical protein